MSDIAMAREELLDAYVQRLPGIPAPGYYREREVLFWLSVMRVSDERFSEQLLVCWAYANANVHRTEVPDGYGGMRPVSPDYVKMDGSLR